jgi:hypothetical protein
MEYIVSKDLIVPPLSEQELKEKKQSFSAGIKRATLSDLILSIAFFAGGKIPSGFNELKSLYHNAIEKYEGKTETPLDELVFHVSGDTVTCQQLQIILQRITGNELFIEGFPLGQKYIQFKKETIEAQVLLKLSAKERVVTEELGGYLSKLLPDTTQ